MKVFVRRKIYQLFAIWFMVMAVFFGFKAWMSNLDPDPVNAPICTAFICVAGLFWVLFAVTEDMKDPVRKEWE